MRVIMTGGGTGGHIYPAIAIAEKIVERSNNSEILFVGTKKGLESKLVPAHGFDIKYIEVSGINRKNLAKNVKVLKDYNQAKKDAKAIIEEFKPDVVVGTGGYVSGPVVRVAASMGIKSFVQEQNAVAGLTNKMLEKHVEKIFLGFEEGGKSFKHKEKLVVSGNPVRPEFFKVKKDRSRQILGIDQDKFVILAFGGSRGAGRINKSMLDVVSKYNGRPDVEIIFGTGSAYYKSIEHEIKDKKLSLADNIHVCEYIEDMQYYISACDLVISRSGAITVSEIAACGKASILVPSPNVTGDHQTFNARAMSDKGGAILLEESKLSGETLYEEIERLRNDKGFAEGMAAQAARCAPVDATDIIYYGLIT